MGGWVVPGKVGRVTLKVWANAETMHLTTADVFRQHVTHKALTVAKRDMKLVPPSKRH